MTEPIQKYTDIEVVNKILHDVENQLAEITGRHEAQKYIGVFAQVVEPNVFVQIFEAGKKAGSKP